MQTLFGKFYKADKKDPVVSSRVVNETEIAQKKVILESRPREIMAVLTNKCNMKCVMCSRVREKSPAELPFEAVKKVYSLLPHMEKVDWQGGEVFLLDYFRELFETVSGYPGIMQEIMTNMLLIDRDWARMLVRSNLLLVCSIDAVKKAMEAVANQGKAK